MISTLIFIHLSGAVSLNSEGSFIGIPVKLGDTALVTAWLLIFNVYFFWRFFTHLLDSKLRYKYSNLLHSYILNVTQKYMKDMGEARAKEHRKTDKTASHAALHIDVKNYLWFFASIEATITTTAHRKEPVLETIKISSFIKLFIIFTQNLKLIIQDKNFSEALLPLFMGLCSFVWLFCRYLNLV